jgi:flagellar protein FlaG
MTDIVFAFYYIRKKGGCSELDITRVNSSITSTVEATVNTPSGSGIAVKNESTISAVENADNKQNTGSTADISQPSKSELKKSTEELNDFMQSMNTDIKFVLHTKTNTLMIQIEDVKNHKILKECPPHELLDMAARLQDLRDYIGSIVDKKV